jgi:phosphopentomutase
LPLILLFIDGFGIGNKNPKVNPLFSSNLPTLTNICGGELFHSKRKRISTLLAEVVPVSATLGLPGLPQSGTGQTAIFTGQNGAKLFGKHFGPYPPTKLRSMIERENIFSKLLAAGKTVCFANAFPRRFFEYTNSGTRRLSVTTLAALAAGVPLLTAVDLRKNAGISADFNRDRWEELGDHGIAKITAETAGEHCAQMAQQVDFLLFEYWLTDHAGHSQKMDFSTVVLERLDQFLSGLLKTLPLDRFSVILISDHGNIEDLSTKSHTRNSVPGIFLGAARNKFAARVKNLTHITPRIVKFLTEHG